MYDNNQNLKQCVDASLFCRKEPNPCCRYRPNPDVEKQCGTYECFHWNENYWSWSKPGLSRYALAMLIQFVFQFAILILIETGIFRRIRYSFLKENLVQSNSVNNEDFESDVVKEENLAQKMLSQKDKSLFVASKLYKCYNDLTAVKRLSFYIDNNECFGLLGIFTFCLSIFCQFYSILFVCRRILKVILISSF